MTDDLLSLLLVIVFGGALLVFGRLLAAAFREGRLLSAILVGSIFFALVFFLALFMQIAMEAM